MNRKIQNIFLSIFLGLSGIFIFLQGVVQMAHSLSESAPTSNRSDPQNPLSEEVNHRSASITQNVGTGSLIWFSETVDEGGEVGVGSSLALDSHNIPHISYNAYTPNFFGIVKYASWNGQEWVSQTVPMVPLPSSPSLDLDSHDYPHIAGGAGQQGISYAYWDGSMWISQTIPSTGSAARASLALDRADRPHISYSDISHLVVKYVYWDGNGWISQIVDSGHVSSLALDSNDNPHISYFNGLDLKFASWDGEAWISQTVDMVAGVTFFTPLALDNNDRPHIAYYDESDFNLKYAHWDGSQWLIQSFFIGPTTPYISLALDSSNKPHISYHHPDSGLEYAYWDGNQWIFQTIDATGDVGYHNSIAVDNNNLPHVSYYDATNRDLKYAYVPTVEINKDGPTNAIIGEAITYTLEIVNILPITLTNVVITDAVPVGATYLNGGTLTGHVVSWTVPALVPGEAVTRQFSVTATDTITNHDYRVSSNEGYNAIGNEVVVTAVDAVITGVQVFSDGPTPLGEMTTFSATVTTGTDVSFLWDFGDGQTAVGAYQTHFYSAPNNYTVTVTAENAVSSVSVQHLVQVVEPAQRIYLPVILRP